jgi:hypothetical protein
MTTLTNKRTEREALDKAALIETVLIKGDLSALTQEERNAYYLRVCESAGLNPLTKPLEYITLNKKLVLYALRSCTDQLRTIHRISVVDMDREDRDGVCIVTVKVANTDGRTDIATGAVFVGPLKGEERANAIMKAETKAKRRATLSICGLGLLDETEVETIPGAAISGAEKVINPETGRAINPNNSNQLRKNGAWGSFADKLQHFADARDLDGLRLWYACDEVNKRINKWPREWRDLAHTEFQICHDAIEAALAETARAS